MKVIRVPVLCNKVKRTVVVTYADTQPFWFSVGIEQRIVKREPRDAMPGRPTVAIPQRSRIVSHRDQTIVAATTLLAARWFRNPNAPRLDKKRLWTLLAKTNPAALQDWKSQMPRSAFDIQLCECLRGWDQRQDF